VGRQRELYGVLKSEFRVNNNTQRHCFKPVCLRNFAFTPLANLHHFIICPLSFSFRRLLDRLSSFFKLFSYEIISNLRPFIYERN